MYDKLIFTQSRTHPHLSAIAKAYPSLDRIGASLCQWQKAQMESISDKEGKKG